MRPHAMLPAVLVMTAACDRPVPAPGRAGIAPVSSTYVVRDTVVTATMVAAGSAAPIERALLSTRLMGNVIAVLAGEGTRVRQGELLIRIDDRDLTARRGQVEAGMAAARSTLADAQRQADRFRALYADSAATRYQLEQSELGLTRAEAGLRGAEAAAAEVASASAYAEIRAPFAGVVTRRLVDPGAFASPGAPLLEIQDDARLRISVTAVPAIAAALHRGDSLTVRIDRVPAMAVVEGVVPTEGGALSTVNLILANGSSRFPSGSSAEVDLPQGRRRVILVPTAALIRQGDLTGVRVPAASGSELRWLRVVPTGRAEWTEVSSGLVPGDVILGREN